MSKVSSEDQRDLFINSVKGIEDSVKELVRLALENNDKNKNYIENLEAKIKYDLNGIQLSRKYDYE